MTDRDHFAAAALTGLLADESLGHLEDITLSIRAYELAAAMMDRRAEIHHGLTDAEREAISEVIDCLTESGTALASPTATRNTLAALLARLA
jgi:hypothetical protein